jgi:predicted Zn-dependent protease|tara:strand:+ start:1280 stop:2602 length:1323 start_codon:yes stop_codon:yes gene_type:complete
MENIFNIISENVFTLLNKEEYLTLSFSSESTQFIRFSQSKIRQTGLVDDATLELELIHNNRTCGESFTLSGDTDADIQSATDILSNLRMEIVQLPEDPYIVLPENNGSSRDIHTGNLLSVESAADALTPAMQSVDLAGIWSSGKIYRGNTNSLGQKHWFSTETFSLDYSLITADEKMVKATFAGSEWNQSDYESFMAKSIKKLEFMKRKAIKVKPGEYRTFIASPGVRDILDMFSWNGLSEASIQQGQSSFGKMRNENSKLSPCFSLNEDFRSGSVPRFNDNGEVAPDVLNLVNGGLLENTLINSRTAKEYNVVSNNAGGGEGVRAPYMAEGELSEADVLKKIGTGLYLGNLHYLNWSDCIGGRITGMTRYACFWVENGEIVAPIENMRFDDSFYNFFGENLEAVSDKVEFNPEVGTYESRSLGGTHCPGVLLSSFSLTL